MRRLLIALAISLVPSLALAAHVGGGPWWVGGYDSCWQWVATPWGLRHTWVCGDYGYY